jgi:rootletin
VKKSEAEKTNIRRKLEETVQKLNTLDEAKNALQKEVGDLRSSLREVEKARLEARRELQQVHNQVSDFHLQSFVSYKMLDLRKNP